MRLQNNTVILAAIHVAIVGIGGVVAGITSPWAWVSLVALAVLFAGSMLVVWSQPLQAARTRPEVRR